MKHEIERLEPRQNAKVIAILTAFASILLMIPGYLLWAAKAPSYSPFPLWPMVVAPLAYLVVGFVVVLAVCWCYNFLYPFIGGIEFESTPATD